MVRCAPTTPLRAFGWFLGLCPNLDYLEVYDVDIGGASSLVLSIKRYDGAEQIQLVGSSRIRLQPHPGLGHTPISARKK